MNRHKSTSTPATSDTFRYYISIFPFEFPVRKFYPDVIKTRKDLLVLHTRVRKSMRNLTKSCLTLRKLHNKRTKTKFKFQLDFIVLTWGICLDLIAHHYTHYPRILL